MFVKNKQFMNNLKRRVSSVLRTKILLFFGIFCFISLCVANILYFVSPVVAASSPQIINYQGKLLEDGIAASTTKQMMFVIYDSLAGDVALYSAGGSTTTPTAVSVTPTSGIFSVNIGGAGTNTLDPAIFKNNQNVYLEVQVGTEILTPRKQVTAVPYSFNSKYLDGVAPSSTSPAEQYIPLTDSSGNIDLNNVSTTQIYSSGDISVDGNATTTLNHYIGGHLSVLGNVSGTWIGDIISKDKITSSTEWDTAYGWGNHADASYLTTSYSETDPIWIASSTGYVRYDSASSTNWNSAYGWGNHAIPGYITDGNTNWDNSYGFVSSSQILGLETDPVWVASSSLVAFLANNQSFTGENTFASSTSFITTTTFPNGIWQADGKVGIGTSTPSTLLTVAGTSTLRYVLPDMTSGTGNVSLYSLGNTTKRWASVWADEVNIGSSTWKLSQEGADRLDITNSNTTTPALSITANNKVGIGTTNPTEKFHLAGGTFLQTINTDPEIKGSITSSTILNDIQDVYVEGNYAYVIASGTMAIIDITVPNSPVIIGSIENNQFIGFKFN